MLNPNNPQQVRSFFYASWYKYKMKTCLPLTPLENLACECIILHPEYHTILADENYINKDFNLENNPFLHLSMHLSIMEQISINQPMGISNIFNALSSKNNYHETLHIMMQALQTTLININAMQNSLDNIQQYYLSLLQQKI